MLGPRRERKGLFHGEREGLLHGFPSPTLSPSEPTPLPHLSRTT
jgi:hypothetical protein